MKYNRNQLAARNLNNTINRFLDYLDTSADETRATRRATIGYNQLAATTTVPSEALLPVHMVLTAKGEIERRRAEFIADRLEALLSELATFDKPQAEPTPAKPSQLDAMTPAQRIDNTIGLFEIVGGWLSDAQIELAQNETELERITNFRTGSKASHAAAVAFQESKVEACRKHALELSKLLDKTIGSVFEQGEEMNESFGDALYPPKADASEKTEARHA